MNEVHGTARSAENIHLTEFNRLREEIDNRTEISSHLVIAQITALGVSVSVIDKFPEALLGLSAVGSLLWLCWLDQTEQIYKIATYIASQLAPRLRDYAGENVFGWESYLRVLDQGGRAATRLLYGDGYSPSHHQVPPTQNVGKYIGLLFGGTTPLVVIIYLLAFVGRPSLPLSHVPPPKLIFLRLAGVALVVMLWLYTYRQYRQFVRTLSYFDGALRDLGHSEEPHSAQVDIGS